MKKPFHQYHNIRDIEYSFSHCKSDEIYKYLYSPECFVDEGTSVLSYKGEKIGFVLVNVSTRYQYKPNKSLKKYPIHLFTDPAKCLLRWEEAEKEQSTLRTKAWDALIRLQKKLQTSEQKGVVAITGIDSFSEFNYKIRNGEPVSFIYLGTSSREDIYVRETFIEEPYIYEDIDFKKLTNTYIYPGIKAAKSYRDLNQKCCDGEANQTRNLAKEFFKVHLYNSLKNSTELDSLNFEVDRTIHVKMFNHTFLVKIYGTRKHFSIDFEKSTVDNSLIFIRTTSIADMASKTETVNLNQLIEAARDFKLLWEEFSSKDKDEYGEQAQEAKFLLKNYFEELYE